jgi:uncharacterized protein YjiS (DUF1127 family)
MNPFALTSRIAASFAFFGAPQRRKAPDAFAILNRFDDHMLNDIGLSRADVTKLGRPR